MYNPFTILPVLFFLFFLLHITLPKEKQIIKEVEKETHQILKTATSKVTMDSLESHLNHLMNHGMITTQEYNDLLRKSIPYTNN